MLAGVIATLTITGHTEGWEELAPLAISCLGLAAIGNVLYEPDPGARSLLWLTSGLSAIGGCYGIFVHIDGELGAVGLIAPSLLVAAAALAVLGSTLDQSKEEDDDEDAEIDSLIAKALQQLDENDQNGQ